MDKLVGWCSDSHILLSVSVTKEIVVDFRRDSPNSLPIGHQWRGSCDRGGIQVPGLRHQNQVGLVPEHPGSKKKKKGKQRLFEEDEVLPRLSEVAGTVFQVQSSQW